MNEINLDRARREEARWRILRVLDVGRPLPVAEGMIWRVLADIHLPITPEGVRRELAYLEDKGLIEIQGRDENNWMGELTGSGVDVVEYALPAPVGISRPPRF